MEEEKKDIILEVQDVIVNHGIKIKEEEDGKISNPRGS